MDIMLDVDSVTLYPIQPSPRIHDNMSRIHIRVLRISVIMKSSTSNRLNVTRVLELIKLIVGISFGPSTTISLSLQEIVATDQAGQQECADVF